MSWIVWFDRQRQYLRARFGRPRTLSEPRIHWSLELRLQFIFCSEFVIRNIAWAPETVPGRPNPKAAAVLAAGGVLGQVAVRTRGLGIEGERLVALAIVGVDRVHM
jgi:hypothetical protein